MSFWSRPTFRRGYYGLEKRALAGSCGGRCGWCGVSVRRKDATIDHIVSLLFGGEDDLRNMVLSCERCNHERSIVTTWFGHYRALRSYRHRMRKNAVPDSKTRRNRIKRTRKRLQRRADTVRQVIAKYEPLERDFIRIRNGGDT